MSTDFIIIGSTALNSHYETRVSRDTDVIVYENRVDDYIRSLSTRKSVRLLSDKKYVVETQDGIVEVEVAYSGTSSWDLLNLYNDYVDGYGMYFFPVLKHLYLLKMSHRYLKDSPHFLKTMRDIKLMRTLNGGEFELNDWDRAFLKKREKETYNYKTPKLQGVKKQDFFSGDGVKYIYDHDTIHLAMATFDRPAYRYFQGDNEINTSKDMFFAQKEIIKLSAVLEEAYVLALERSVIPFNGDPRAAFDIALMKICTSITSGWFREYAWENYDKVQLLYNSNYVAKFQRGIEDGIVRPYEGNGET